MPMSRIDKEKVVFNLLVAKYQADRAWFKRNLPDVIPYIDDAVSPPRPSPPPFRLSDRTRASHLEALSNIRGTHGLERADAMKELERCAALIMDDWLRNDISYETRVSLFKSAFGKLPEAFEENTTLYADGARDTETAHQVSLVRGVVLSLDANLRLVSVSVTPYKVRERERMMSIVGIGRDSKGDIAARHDEYLAEISPHGCS